MSGHADTQIKRKTQYLGNIPLRAHNQVSDPGNSLIHFPNFLLFTQPSVEAHTHVSFSSPLSELVRVCGAWLVPAVKHHWRAPLWTLNHADAGPLVALSPLHEGCAGQKYKKKTKQCKEL